MKRNLLILSAGVMLVGQALSAVILNDPFDYPDGGLIAVSGGLWTNHSGTLNQVEVSSGKVNLSQSESEDVNAQLAGAPYRGPTLYASFLVSFSALPEGAGTYFAHFKDATATGARCRIFATTNGAAGGKFRVGVANGAGTPVNVPTDLDLAAEYVLVVRYNTGTPQSALWINPASESVTGDRADATDTTSALSITSFALRQSGPNPGMGVLTFDNLKVGTSFNEVVAGSDPRLNPPTLTRIPDQTIPANTATPPVPFVISDGETPAASLSLGATFDNPSLVSEVLFGGSGSNRTVTVTLSPGRQGVATVTVTVTDGDNNTAFRNFRVTVGAPALSAIPDQITPVDTPTSAIAFTVGDAESDPLRITLGSTNQILVPVDDIVLGGTGSNRTVTITPAAGLSGQSRITLFLSDGFNTVSQSFVLTVFPTHGVVLCDPFNYADGSIVANALFFWSTHSASTGQTGQTQVVQGRLLLSSSQSEDIHAFLTNAPYTPAEGWFLYARFTVNFSVLPHGAPDTFAHFRNTGNGFGARVFAATNGAAPGKLRLGISNNAGNPSAILPVDLETNATYTVVTRYKVGTGQSTLWVNPGSENDAGATATATDNPVLFDVWTYAFRQSGGIGALAVDDLKIGTAFSDVVLSRYHLQVQTASGGVEISWPAAAAAADYKLQSNETLDPAGWSDVSDLPAQQGDRLIVRILGFIGNRFFRLIRP